MGCTRPRRGVLLALAAVLPALVLHGCGGGNSSPPLPGYLRNCLVDGRLVRWSRMPINVFFDTSARPENWKPVHQTLFQEATNEWAAASGGTISFNVISTPSLPRINVKWVKDSPMGHPDAAGVAKFDAVTFQGRLYFDVIRIEIATTRAGSGIPYRDQDIKLTSLHEIGHALGLWGHSDSPDDIMFGEGPIDITAVSSRDAATLNGLYLLRPDISEVPPTYTRTGRKVFQVEIP